jgi:MFS family permease
VIAGRLIGRFGHRDVLVAGMAVQSLSMVPLLFIGTHRIALGVIIPVLFVSFFGHVTAIVAYTVTGTTGLAEDEHGLATGMTSMTQQVAISVGIPILSSVAATQTSQMSGLRLALGIDVAVTAAGLTLTWLGLTRHRRRPDPTEPLPLGSERQLTASKG